MNKHMLKLLGDAGFHQPEMERLGIEDKFEKFAELIVEECVAQCWTVSEIEHKGNVLSECSKRMRKYFGVKE